MGVSHFLSSFCCELRILQAKNIEPVSPGNLFIRYYLSAGNNNKRIQLNSQEISSKAEMFIWNELFSLECSGTEQSLNYLKQQTVVFELRWRRRIPVLGKMGKSQVLGRAEMPWKAVFESPNLEIEKYWLPMVPMNNGVLESLKPPSVQISMKLVRGAAIVETEKKNRKERLKTDWDGCGCKDINGGWCSCADYEILALAAAMEGVL